MTGVGDAVGVEVSTEESVELLGAHFFSLDDGIAVCTQMGLVRMRERRWLVVLARLERG